MAWQYKRTELLASLLTYGMATSKRRLAKDTTNSSSSTGSTKPQSKPGKKVYPFFAANNKTAQLNSC